MTKPFGVVQIRDKGGMVIGWRAIWNDPPTVQRSKRFMYKDYGAEAYEKALKFRLAQVANVVNRRREFRENQVC